jgi:hypothetical protein
MHDVLAPGSRDIQDVFDALVADGVATEQDPRAWTTWQVGDAGRMVDEGRRPCSECAIAGVGTMGMTFPRVDLALLPTPLVRASRLERALQAGPIYLKRDDLTGFGIAGNKARTLEYLLGAALAEEADIVVTPAARRRTSVRVRRWPRGWWAWTVTCSSRALSPHTRHRTSNWLVPPAPVCCSTWSRPRLAR